VGPALVRDDVTAHVPLTAPECTRRAAIAKYRQGDRANPIAVIFATTCLRVGHRGGSKHRRFTVEKVRISQFLRSQRPGLLLVATAVGLISSCDDVPDETSDQDPTIQELRGRPNYTGQLPILPDGVPPVIRADCPGDPTAGWTKYSDTFHIERPFDLPIASRFSIADGIYTFWVKATDNPHVVGSTTAPRTEARWSNFTNSRMHMWEADVMFETPLDHTTIMQVHTTAAGAGPVYLRVDNGAIHPLNGPNFVTGLDDKWFNMKVAFDPVTLSTTIWINNCRKLQGVIGPRGDGVFYFKNGAYTCPGTICRDHYKNIHLYQK
jgi:hypothetical protein